MQENRLRSIHSSLAIENNALSLDEVAAVINGKTVLAPPRDILEAKNAYQTYGLMEELNPLLVADLLKAQQELDAAVGDAASVRASLKPDEEKEKQAKKGWAVAATESKAMKVGGNGKGGTFNAFEMGAIQGNTMEDMMKSSLRQQIESVTQLKKMNANIEGMNTFE